MNKRGQEFSDIEVDLDEICGQLIETAEYSGGFGDDSTQRSEELEEQFFEFDAATSAQEYYNITYSRVQLGDTMSVTVSK